MALAPGTRLGPYEITAQIGVGGMGEVYRATDTNLARQVAIKVLPEAVAADAERLARFDREAKTLAALNHPNIGAIYGLEKADGIRALVMELVEGPTLADRIAQGPIPIDEALPIAKQIAEALEAAHEQGIIHRDLKPANIKLRPDGTVKVLDFGLAKTMEPAAAVSSSLSMSPTITTPAMTQAGIILGTAAYMSPEQARGTAVDKRADVWAFGVVLWEMLTGKRLFEGATVSDTLAAVLKTEPGWNALGPATPTAIRRLLRRCLEKDRKQRLDSAAAARLEIEEALTAPSAVESAAVPAPSSASRGRLAWMVAASAVLVVAAAAVWQQRHATTAPRPVTRFEIAVPQTDSPTSLSLSPDGRQLAYVATTEGQSRVWVRLLDDTDPRPLVGTEGASFPFWAPDASAIGFFAEGKLKRVDLAGGASQALADAPNGRGGTWNSEGVILFTPGNAPLAPNSVITRVSAAGGTPIAVTHLGPGEGSHRWPQFLPDGRRFMFFSTVGRSDSQGVYLGSLDGGEPIRVLATETPGVFVPPDRLLLVRGDALMAARFDAAQGTVAGELMQLVQPVGRDDGVLANAFSVAPGTLAYRATGGSQRRQLVWMDRTGKMVGSIGSPDSNQLAQLALDPAGQRIAVVRTILGNFDVWLVDTSRGIPARFTFDPGGDRYPLWSPDGRRVVFWSVRGGPLSLYEKSASGAGDEQLLAADAGVPLSWSPDGRFLLYQRAEPKTGIDLWVLSMTGERKSLAVVQTAMDQPGGEFSPDGRWLAYESNESGRFEVYVQPFPEAGGKWQISSAGGTQPRWRRDGKELYYVAPDARLMAVTVAATPDGKTLDPGVPVPLFRTPLASGAGVSAGRPEYAVAPDGRFLMNTVVDDTAPSPITVVLNWEEELGW
jgi:eukaryotic-like serine/threonine-protein kinase